MNNQSDSKAAMAVIAGAVIAISSFLTLKYSGVIQQNLPLALLIEAIAGGGLFVAMYQVLYSVWVFLIWPLFYRKYWFGGYWKMTNYHNNGEETEGIFEIKQRLFSVQLSNGRNTTCKKGDRYIARWSSTSSNLEILNSGAVAQMTYSYKMEYDRADYANKGDTSVLAVELLETVNTGRDGRPSLLRGKFYSTVSVSSDLAVPPGSSENERISRERYEELLKKHLELERSLAKRRP